MRANVDKVPHPPQICYYYIENAAKKQANRAEKGVDKCVNFCGKEGE